MRHRETQRTIGDLRDQRFLLRRAAGKLERGAGQHHGREIRFQGNDPAQRFHDDHGLDAAAAEPAMLLGERKAQ